MNYKYALLPVIGLFATSCAKKADAGPSIPANSLQLADNGQTIAFPPNTATAVLETNAQGQKQMTITATTTDNHHQVSFFFADRQGVETARTYQGLVAGSAYTVALTNYSTVCRPVNTNTQLYQFYTAVTSPPDFQVVVQAVDATNHTVSGTFAGTYSLGCDSRKITNGQFNLPYTVKP